MLTGSGDRRELARYAALAQVGLEMAVPPGIGAWIDHAWGTGPWAVIVGAVLGLSGGLAHLVQLTRREERRAAEARDARSSPDAPPPQQQSESR